MIVVVKNMKNKNIKIILIIILLLGVGYVYKEYFTKEDNSKDALRFKEEYEELNGTIRESDDAKYNSVKIPRHNPIKYITVKEAVEIIQKETGVIYFGANWCPWCRNAIEVLIDVAKQKKEKKIYYLDMDKVRNTWELVNGNLNKVTNEEEGYYDLLKALDSILGDQTYTLTDEFGNIHDTGEKRIYMPLIIGVKNGKILKNHTGTITLKEEQTKYDKLTKEQKQDLKKIYSELIDATRKD